ncbi:DUF262 domain-containing protein [Flavisolibacter sp. BT320]|nr:DUF262 domain-containing protein [Flavisolibacter longurius]
MKDDKLISSIPANNEKIIQLYNKLESKQLDPSPDFQRKLVWRKQHKYDFIETILKNFPFPEVYIAPGKIDTVNLGINELIVDGQQRLTTIQNYINEYDVFALDNIPIKKFSELEETQKKDFLGYEVSVRYLKNANEKQIKDIFQRINSTEYALNTTERLNAQWGDSEFICFGKQMIEAELNLNMELVNYEISASNRNYYLDFFHEQYNVFTENDVNRMLSLQFILTLIATICEESYFNRNLKVQSYIEAKFEDFPEASEIDHTLISTLKFINKLSLNPTSYWFNKANIFTLIIELYKYDVSTINRKEFKSKLQKLEEDNQVYLDALKAGINPSITATNRKYVEFSREGVNGKPARDYRGKLVNRLIKESLK